jgi:hypothetical protein
MTCTVIWREGLVDGLTLAEAKELAAELVEQGYADISVQETELETEARRGL